MIFRTTVPPNGTRPGQLLRVTVYDGSYGYITLPPGFGPGDDLDFEMEVDDEDGMREFAGRNGLSVPLAPKQKGERTELRGKSILLRVWRNIKGGGGQKGKGKRQRDAERSFPVAFLVHKGGTGPMMPLRHKLPRAASLSDHLPPEILGVVSTYLDFHEVNALALCSVRGGAAAGAAAASDQDDDAVGAVRRSYVVGVIRRSFLRRNFRYLSSLWRITEYGARRWGIETWMDANPDWKQMYTRPCCKALRWDYTDDYTLPDDEEDEGCNGSRSSASPFFSPPRRHPDGPLIDYDRFSFDCIFDDLRGAVSFSLTDVLRYLVEERDADVNELCPEHCSSGGYDNSDGLNGDEDEEQNEEDWDADDDGSGGDNVGGRRPPLFYALIDSREAPVLSSPGQLNDQSQRRQVTPLEYLLSLPSLNVNWSWTNDAGSWWNLFQFAACSGQISPSNFSLLLNHPGIDVDARPGPCRRSALHDACINPQNEGSAEKVRLLLEAGADPNIVDGRECTPWRRMSDWWDGREERGEDISEEESAAHEEIAKLLRDAGGIDPKGDD